MLLPSSIQRADDLVGMAMPTVPLLWASAPVTAVAAMVVASASADNVVFRLVMLLSLPHRGFLIGSFARSRRFLSCLISRIGAAPRPPSSGCQFHIRFRAAAHGDIQNESAAVIGIGA